MKLSRKLILIAAVLGIFLIAPSIFAATTFTANVEGLEALPGLGYVGVVGFTVWLDVSSDFNFIGFARGDAIPSGEDGQVLGWADSPAPSVLNNQFRYGAFDQDFAFIGSGPFPLANGTLFSFAYDGLINSVAVSEFAGVDTAGATTDLFAADVIRITKSTPEQLTYAVPIPSAIFLLGGGLISLFAVVRRRRS